MVQFFMDDTYEVLASPTPEEDFCEFDWDNNKSVFQGSLSDCEAYIRLHENGYMV